MLKDAPFTKDLKLKVSTYSTTNDDDDNTTASVANPSSMVHPYLQTDSPLLAHRDSQLIHYRSPQQTLASLENTEWLALSHPRVLSPPSCSLGCSIRSNCCDRSKLTSTGQTHYSSYRNVVSDSADFYY